MTVCLQAAMLGSCIHVGRASDRGFPVKWAEKYLLYYSCSAFEEGLSPSLVESVVLSLKFFILFFFFLKILWKLPFLCTL